MVGILHLGSRNTELIKMAPSCQEAGKNRMLWGKRSRTCCAFNFSLLPNPPPTPWLQQEYLYLTPSADAAARILTCTASSQNLIIPQLFFPLWPHQMLFSGFYNSPLTWPLISDCNLFLILCQARTEADLLFHSGYPSGHDAYCLFYSL